MSIINTMDIIEQLNQPLDHTRIKQFDNKSGAKAGLSFLEGHDVIRELNEVFDFQWSHTIYNLHCVGTRTYKSSRGAEMVNPYYICEASITVKIGDERVTHHGVGGGGSSMPESSIAEAHEFAAKGAETDALKRAAMKLGDRFGLALYDKAQENVTAPYNPNVAAADLLKQVTVAHKLEREAAVSHITQVIRNITGQTSRFVELEKEQADRVVEAALSTPPQPKETS